jgi:hypothetical protein
MARLTAAGRAKIPTSKFAGPNRSYPIPDRGHAIAAESDAAKFASPAVKARVDADVRRTYPGLGGQKAHSDSSAHHTIMRSKG